MEQNQIPQEIQTFLDSLLEKANIVPINDDMRQEMIMELFVELNQFVTAKLTENIPLEHLDAFLEVQKENDPKKLEDFLTKSVPDVQQLYTDAFTEFGQMYVDNVEKAREQQQA